tara:strand:+ start:711 stop:899 length:189 start_codon:yes stop_codon:yes gene_type:complete
MIKILVKKTLEIPQDEFDSWCKSNRIGRKFGRQIMKENLEQAVEDAFNFEIQQTKKMKEYSI